MNKKPTYEELERSLKELDRIFNLSIDMIGSGNLDGYFTKINSSFKQILGYTEEEILENPFILFVHDEDIEKTKKALADAIEGKKDICIENRYKCKDGSYKWIEWKILSIIQDNKFIAVGREITERKWAEKAILQNEHILNQSQGVSNVGSFSLDIEKNQVFWSKQLYKIFGYEHGEVQPDFDLVVSHIHPDDKDSFIQSNQISLSGKRDYDEVYRIIRKDGEVRTVHSKAKVEFDVSGNPLRTYGALQDITNRKQKEEALQASEHFLKNVFDSIQDGISVLDTDLNIIKTNRWMEKAYTKKMPFAGQKCYQVYQERKSPCPWCPTLQTIQTGEANTQIVPYPSDEDPIGWIELTAFPIKDETGHITSIIEYVKDITDRKQTEEAIRKSEEKFSKVFHCGPAIEGISDLETGEYIEVNQAFYDKLGFTTKEVIGKKSTEVVHLDDKFRARMIAKMKRHGQIKNEDGIIYTKTGTPMNVLFSAEIIEFAGKKYNYSTVIDITDLKHAEKALRESEKRLRQISDTTFEGIVLHNHGEIIYANDQYYNIFGYTKEELSGVDAISLTVSPNSIKKMKKLISSGNLGPYEVIGIKKNGDKFPIEIHAKISEYHGQKIRLAAIRDITRYKQAEEDTRKALEYAAEQSKHSLIGQVAGKMAHDFNNVLMGIMGNAQLALLNCDDEKTKKG